MRRESALKKTGVVLTVLCAAVLMACGNKEEKSPASVVANGAAALPALPRNINNKESAVAEAGAPMTVEANMPEVATKNNCVYCHSIGKKVVGPAWIDVSRKYKGVGNFEYNGKEYPLVDGLILKVSQGGSGHWGSMPMPANDPSGAKKADITELVHFILGLAK